ncbi:Ni/Co efflux regulator RcnB [Mesorhizobium sp. J18]|uniref:RcnB family protein n=1 Tax=Mesorhizobium sp. J18 TaxID=935263 RepID=UPI00119AA565|nr:RcnB family protein [Mesorhizobium sp. J18]TWG94741.1 Ni/Co efflux regulator RcnB [Mesorhizobium sp. J18]
MKRLSKILLAAVAASVMMAPLANAQPRHDNRPPAYQHVEKKRPAVYKKHVSKQHARHHWKRGDRISDWKKRAAVRDYHRHGLKKPARGQQWVKVDNDYLLISIATGVIAGIVASR